MDKRELKEIIKDYILIKKGEENNFFFTNVNGNWIFDFRLGFTKASILSKFATFFWDFYERDFPFQVGGLESGSIPFIAAIAMEGMNRGKDTNTFFVRKIRKDTGLGNKIEGKLNGEKIIIVDDLLNSGSSILKVVDSLGSHKKNLFKVFVFINYGNQQGRHNILSNGLDIDSVFTLSDFGLDIFGNDNSNLNKKGYSPMIFPNMLFLHKLNNPNKFLPVVKSNIAKEGKDIYFGGEGGSFVKICSDTGLQRAEFLVNKTRGHKNILSSPLIHKDNLIFGSYDGNLYCLNKKDFSLKWKNIYTDWIGSSPTASVNDDLIYVGGEHAGKHNKGSLMAVSFLSGETIWQHFFDDYVHCSPVYSDRVGFVLCGSNDGKLISCRGDNGKVLFIRKFKGSIKGGFVLSTDQRKAYFGCFDNNIYCIDSLSGEVVWQYETGNVVYSKGLIVGKHVFFGSTDKYFYHLDNKGILLNKIETYGKIFSEPIFIKDGLIAFSSYDGCIHFYNYDDKKVLFRIEHEERISTKLLFDKDFGHLYVYDFLNQLFKYDITKYV